MMINSFSPVINPYPTAPTPERAAAPVQSQPNRDTFTHTPDEAERTTYAKNMLRDFLGTDESITSEKMMDDFAENVDFDLEEAQELFSTMGNLDWNSTSTADMIYEMAKQMSDGEPELMELMRSAVKDAFAQVENSMGGEGKLPPEAYATMNRLNAMFSE